MNENLSIKNDIISQVLEELKEKSITVNQQIDQTRKDVIKAPSRMESRYDSSRQELSYLAQGYQKKLLEIEKDIEILKNFETKENYQEVSVGSLVKIKRDSEYINYLILPVGGGIVINNPKIGKVIVVTPKAPFATSIIGKKINDSITINLKKMHLISIT